MPRLTAGMGPTSLHEVGPDSCARLQVNSVHPCHHEGMALSRQVTPTYVLNIFNRWAHLNGYRVGEHPDYGGVTPGVHVADSWHDLGLASDINWGTNNPSVERNRLISASVVAESMGLALTYAQYGTAGSAANHRNHLHVDVGEWSNYGTGNVRRTPGSLVPYRLQEAVFRDPKQRDNIWGDNTEKRLNAVRMSSRMHGTKFPYGIAFTRRILGAGSGKTWDREARQQHDAAVLIVQEVLKVDQDAVWGPDTDSAYLTARSRYLR